MLAAPVCAGISAYALCLYLCRRPGPALLGGWIFGFSSFAAAHLNQQLNLEWDVLLPLLALVGLRRLQNEAGSWTTILCLALLLALQAGMSLELCATSCLFAGLSWLLAFWLLPLWRGRLWRLAWDVMLAAPLTICLLSPMLWAMFGQPHDMSLPKMWPEFFATDPLNFVFPTVSSRLGGQAFLPLTSHFAGLVCEQAGYLGLPLLFILWRYLRRSGAFPVMLLLCVLVLTLGPELVVSGQPSGLPLPWLVVTKLPLIGNALPARFMVYAFMLAAIFIALWLAQAPTRGRWVAAGLAVLFLWPAPASVEAIPVQPFFTPSEIVKTIGPDKRVLVLPWGIFSPSMYWQAKSDFVFSQIGGYLVFPPARVQQNGPLMRLFFGQIDDQSLPALKAYALASGVQDVIVAPGTDPRLAAGIASWGWPARQVDGVSLYTAP